MIEELGYYNPLDPEADKQLALKMDRIEYWLNVGARPSDTVRRLIERGRSAAATT